MVWGIRILIRVGFEVNGQERSGRSLERSYLPGTSHAHPGYLFSNQVPPISEFFSYTVSSTFRSLSGMRMAQLMPEKPAPTTTTRYGRKFSIGTSSREECTPLVVGGTTSLLSISEGRDGTPDIVVDS